MKTSDKYDELYKKAITAERKVVSNININVRTQKSGKMRFVIYSAAAIAALIVLTFIFKPIVEANLAFEKARNIMARVENPVKNKAVQMNIENTAIDNFNKMVANFNNKKISSALNEKIEKFKNQQKDKS